MTTIYATEIGETKKGTGRLWLQGGKLLQGRFTPTTTYKRVFKNGTLMLIADKDGEFVVSGKKAQTKSGRVDPVIDICNKDVEKWFPIGTKLRAVVRKGKIIIRRAMQTIKHYKRNHRVMKKLAAGTALSMISLFHGGGVMDRAIHEGLTSQGIPVKASVVAELNSEYLDASRRANGHLFDENTVFFSGPVQDFDLGKVVPGDVFCAGIPCTGASVAGRAKNKTANAEEHKTAGTLFFTTLEWIKHFGFPPMVVLENVKPFQSTASMTIIRSLLASWNYEVHEMILNGVEYGALENRDRLVVVAVAKDLATEGFKPEMIMPLTKKPANVAEILEPIGEDDERWSTFPYLAKKEAEDIKAGKGFRRQIYSPESETVNTLVANYAKIQSTGPLFQHPTNPEYFRLFTEFEHGRIKGMPEGFVEALDVSRTVAHQILGQSVVYPVFTAVGAAIGRFLSDLRDAVRAHEPESGFGQLELVA